MTPELVYADYRVVFIVPLWSFRNALGACQCRHCWARA